MAPKGMQVVMGSSTKLPGSSAPTERPAYPPGAAGLSCGTAGRGSAKEYEKNPAAVAMYGGPGPATALRAAGFN